MAAPHFDLRQTPFRAPAYPTAMDVPLRISLRSITHSDALYRDIRSKAKKLERFYDHIVSCRVVLELAARRQRKRGPYCARIDLKVPGADIVVTHEHDSDLHIALHDAFDAARRRLEDYARTRRGDVKQHAMR